MSKRMMKNEADAWAPIEVPTGKKKERMEFIDRELQKVRKAERAMGLLEVGDGVGRSKWKASQYDVEWPELPTAKGMGRELGIDEKTVRTTINEMRDIYGMPIDPDPVRHGYRYTEDVTFSPVIQFSENEVVAMYLAQNGMLQNTVFRDRLKSGFRKLAGLFGGKEKLSFPLELLDEGFSFEAAGPHAVFKPAHLDACAWAMLRREELLITYTKQHGEGAGLPEVRRVRPLHITYRDFAYYVLCLDQKRAKQPRLFMVTRMSAVEQTGVRFERPEGFDAREYLDRAFKLFAGEEAVKVVLRFAPAAAARIRERKWHSTQKLRDLEGGAVEMMMRCGLAPDLFSWLAGYFGEATILEPGELRVAMRERHLQALAALE